MSPDREEKTAAFKRREQIPFLSVKTGVPPPLSLKKGGPLLSLKRRELRRTFSKGRSRPSFSTGRLSRSSEEGTASPPSLIKARHRLSFNRGGLPVLS